MLTKTKGSVIGVASIQNPKLLRYNNMFYLCFIIGISVPGILSGAICALSIWAESAAPKSYLIISSDRPGSM